MERRRRIRDREQSLFDLPGATVALSFSQEALNSYEIPRCHSLLVTR